MNNRNENEKWMKHFLLLTASLLILSIFVGACLLYAIQPFHVELGTGEIEEKLFFSINPGATDRNINEAGSFKHSVKFFNCISLDHRFEISDKTPPEAEFYNVTVSEPLDVSPDDFIKKYIDHSPVKAEIVSQTLTDVKLKLTDSAGNAKTFTQRITRETKGYTIDASTSDDAIALVSEMLPEYSISLTRDIENGGFRAVAVKDNDKMIFPVRLDDNILATNRDISAGDIPEASNFAADVSKDCKFSYTETPDFTKAGDTPVKLCITDEFGYSVQVEVTARVHDFPDVISVEAGIQTPELIELLRSYDSSEYAIADDIRFEFLDLGKTTIYLNGEYSRFPVTVCKVDTVAPVVKFKNIEKDMGVMPYPSEFVEECHDATMVSFSFENQPAIDCVGGQTVTIIATDSGGNTVKGTAILTVVHDVTPPVIYGIRTIYSYEGDTISYRQNVYAEDASDGRVAVRVNASNVKTSVPGSYTVTYTASDKKGNTASETARVEILEITYDVVNAIADKVIAEIMTGTETDREKAKKIYDWCTENIKYSTVTSYLTGQFPKAGYSGFKLKYGNCYVYFSVTGFLLSRAGLENMEIHRNSIRKPHFWNLVKIDGEWYHLDTCPQPYPNKEGCFLLTDKQVAEYSKKQKDYYSFDKSLYPATPE